MAGMGNNNSFVPQRASVAKGYTAAELTTMQRDAVKRVNEMQKIAKQKLAMQYPTQITSEATNKQESFQNSKQANNHSSIHFAPSFMPQTNTQQPVIENSTIAIDSGQLINYNDNQSGFLKGILDKLNLDTETLILLGLLLMLVNEGADNMLILALVYILL